jgi:hypothetical protein
LKDLYPGERRAAKARNVLTSRTGRLIGHVQQVSLRFIKCSGRPQNSWNFIET